MLFFIKNFPITLRILHVDIYIFSDQRIYSNLDPLPPGYEGVYGLRDVPGESVLPQVVGPDGEGPVVRMRDHQRVLNHEGRYTFLQERIQNFLLGNLPTLYTV